MHRQAAGGLFDIEISKLSVSLQTIQRAAPVSSKSEAIHKAVKRSLDNAQVSAQAQENKRPDSNTENEREQKGTWN